MIYVKLERLFRVRPVSKTFDFRPYQYFKTFKEAKRAASMQFKVNLHMPDVVYLDISHGGKKLPPDICLIDDEKVMRTWSNGFLVYFAASDGQVRIHHPKVYC